MSVMELSNTHIGYVVASGILYGTVCVYVPEEVCALLWRANQAALQHRYRAHMLRDCPTGEQWAQAMDEHRRQWQGEGDIVARSVTQQRLAQVLKAVACTHYQLCESPTFKGSRAQWLLEDLERDIARAFLSSADYAKRISKRAALDAPVSVHEDALKVLRESASYREAPWHRDPVDN